MPVRGKRSIYPDPPGTPTGIFSTRGSQKLDKKNDTKHVDTMNYALGSGTRSKPKGEGGRNLRHQKPVKQY